MSSYFKTIDSLPHFEFEREGSKLLRAYYEDDTSYLQQRYVDLVHSLGYRQNSGRADSCDWPAPLNENRMAFSEAYRFKYSAAFCDTLIVVTIGKRTSQVVADIRIYNMRTPAGECMLSQSELILNEAVWLNLVKGIDYADFWQLKADDTDVGLDGSIMEVAGFQRPYNAFAGSYNVISRWSYENSAMGAVLKEVVKATGIKVTCFRYLYEQTSL